MPETMETQTQAGPQPQHMIVGGEVLQAVAKHTLESNAALGQLTRQVALMNSHSITPFSGRSKDFRDWVRQVEKVATVTGNNSLTIAYQCSQGTVSNFIQRWLEATPQSEQIWETLKRELKARFGEVVDEHHALSLLKAFKQKGHNVQIYAEKLLEIATDAYSAAELKERHVQVTLANFFIDGISSGHIKRKLMRAKPKTLEAAVTLATEEQNLDIRLHMRSGDQGDQGGASAQEYYDEPMDINRVRRQRKGECYKCGKLGHIAKFCRSRRVNAVQVPAQGRQGQGQPQGQGQGRGPSQDRTCYNCGSPTHFARNCRQPKAQGQGQRHQGQGRQGQQGTQGTQGSQGPQAAQNPPGPLYYYDAQKGAFVPLN